MRKFLFAASVVGLACTDASAAIVFEQTGTTGGDEYSQASFVGRPDLAPGTYHFRLEFSREPSFLQTDIASHYVYNEYQQGVIAGGGDGDRQVPFARVSPTVFQGSLTLDPQRIENPGPFQTVYLADTFRGGGFEIYDGGGGLTPFQFTFTISDNATAVPEPETWALMIGGFGLLGAAARCRKVSVALTY